jgi:hypothetical protein
LLGLVWVGLLALVWCVVLQLVSRIAAVSISSQARASSAFLAVIAARSAVQVAEVMDAAGPRCGCTTARRSNLVSSVH